MAPEELLRVEKLGISLGDRQIVKNVEFSIGRRETLALVGESGSGKTLTALSLMRLLPGMFSVTSGRAMFQGADLLRISAADMRHLSGNRLAMVFQEPMSTLNPVMTVGYQVREVLKSHFSMTNAEAEKQVVRMFERVRIPAAKSRFNDYPHSFSGGMRQRIIIAAAIICKPDLLVADEPTTALDVTVQAQVLNLLRELQQEYGMSMLFITHDMGVVSTVADRVIVMRHGEMLETAPVEEIFHAPKHSYTQELIRSSSHFEAGTVASPTEPSNPQKVLQVTGLTTRFDVRGGLWNRKIGRVHAVEDVSLELHKGRTLALVGESGSGKSTIGRALVGLSRPTSGMIFYNARRIQLFNADDVHHLRSGVQMIFQDPFGSFNPRISINDAIAEPLLCRGLCASRKEALEKVAFYLERVGLDPRMGQRYPHQFSGGQRQRISIAKAISMRPDVIVADEAVSALDVTTKTKIIDLLKDLQQAEGISMLFISHDIAAVNKISHSIAVMHMGRIVEIGAKDQILKNPMHPYTRRLLSATLSIDTHKRKLPVDADLKELTSPMHAMDYQVPQLSMQRVDEDHFILQTA